MKMQDNYNNLRKFILHRLKQYCSNCLALDYNHCKECEEKDFSFEELKDLMFFFYIHLREKNCSVDCGIINNLNKCIGKDFEVEFELYYSTLITGSSENTKEFRQVISRKVLFYLYLIMLHLESRYNQFLTRSELENLYDIGFYKKCFSDYKCDWDCIMNIPIVPVTPIPQPPVVVVPECEPVEFSINRIPVKAGSNVFDLEITIHNHKAEDNCEYDIAIKEKDTDIYVSEIVDFNYGTPAIANFISEYYEAGKEYDMYVQKHCENCEDVPPTKITDVLKEELSCDNDVDTSAWEIKNIGGFNHYLLLDNLLLSDKYELCWGNSNFDFAGCNPIANTSKNGKIAFILYGYNSFTSYTFKVRKICAKGVFSDWVSFDKTPDPTPPPTGGCSFNGFEVVEVTDTSITVKVLGFQEYANYELIYNHTDNYLLNTLVNITTEYHTITGLAPETLYKLTMRRKCGATTISFQFIRGATTLPQVPQPPQPKPLCEEPEFTYEVVKGDIKYNVKIHMPHDVNDGCIYKVYYKVLNDENERNGMAYDGDMLDIEFEDVFNKNDVVEFKATKECPNCEINSAIKTITIEDPTQNETDCKDFNVLVGVDNNTNISTRKDLVINIIDNQDGCDYVVNALNTNIGLLHSATLKFPNKKFVILDVNDKDVFSIEVIKICDGCDKSKSGIIYEVGIDEGNTPILDDDDDNIQ